MTPADLLGLAAIVIGALLAVCVLSACVLAGRSDADSERMNIEARELLPEQRERETR